MQDFLVALIALLLTGIVYLIVAFVLPGLIGR